jgi:biopolymer transport protein ExbD
MKTLSPIAYGLLRDHAARHRHGRGLTIIPMLDIMVILAFFLIFTAVFTRTNVLELQLPGPGAAAAGVPPALELEVILGRSGLEVADRGSGVLQAFPATPAGQDLGRLSGFLVELKQRHPEVSRATLLVADDVDYDTIVQVMDAISVRQVAAGAEAQRVELFPQISLGDAPT